LTISKKNRYNIITKSKERKKNEMTKREFLENVANGNVTLEVIEEANRLIEQMDNNKARAAQQSFEKNKDFYNSVLNLVEDREDITAREIADTLNENIQRVNGALRKLENLGLIHGMLVIQDKVAVKIYNVD
jgi:polyhydroxyalkanoate synthesis regulator phasin